MADVLGAEDGILKTIPGSWQKFFKDPAPSLVAASSTSRINSQNRHHLQQHAISPHSLYHTLAHGLNPISPFFFRLKPACRIA